MKKTGSKRIIITISVLIILLLILLALLLRGDTREGGITPPDESGRPNEMAELNAASDLVTL